MKKRLLSIALAISACAPVAMAQTTYTWTGASATDVTDWTLADNWDANGVPVDTIPGLNLSLNDVDKIILDVSSAPTLNVPTFGGEYDASNDGTDSTPAIEFVGTGSWTVPQQIEGVWTNRDSSSDRYIWKVGSGVTLTQAGDINMNRHGDGDHRVLVEGTLNFGVNLNFSQRNNTFTTRNTIFEMAGGHVNVLNGYLYNAGGTKHFLFSSIGSTVTAKYGTGQFGTFAAAEAAVGPGGAFQSADPLVIALEIVEDAPNSRYTVTAVAAPAPNYWSGNGSAVLGDASNNFTTNAAADPLTEGTFADVLAVPADPLFDDVYSFNGGTSPVNTSTLTTVAGGVNADFLQFYNTATTYSIHSPDAFGISGKTALVFNSTGTLILTGSHDTTASATVPAGATLQLGDGTTDGTLDNAVIASTGALVFDVVGNLERTTAISGAGTIEKTGPGTLTLDGNFNGSNADVTISEGELVLEHITNQNEMESFDIAAGATLTYSNANGAQNLRGNVTFTGEGTLRRSRDGGASGFTRWRQEKATFALSSGALFYLEAGTETQGSSSANEVWTNNLSDLEMEAGAIFQGQEGNVRVDAINGAGEIRTGLDNAYYQDGFTFGVDNGSGDFTGVLVSTGPTPAKSFFVKEGTGTQTFDGDSPNFIGDFIVEDGTLSFLYNSGTYFFPKGSGSTNSVSVATGATVNFGGVMTIDLSGAVAAPGSSWQLVDTSGGGTANYTPDDFIIFTEQSGVDFIETSIGSGVWELSQGIGTYTFTESTGALTFDIAAGSNLWTGIGGVTWDQNSTSNFSDNDPADPISNVTFDTATATSLTAIFTDEYYADGAGNPVAETGISIAAGGVQIVGGSVIFANVSAPYVITSTDAIGIYGDTAIDVNGNITLAGTHTTTGATTVGGGITLTLDAATAASYASPIAGDGNIEKTGGDTLTLTSTATYAGSTTVSAGTLKITANNNSNAVTIASGATLEIDYNNRWGSSVGDHASTISGEGTLVKSGVNTLNFFEATIALGTGSLIHVQGGQLTGSSGGSGGSENWTGNLSDLTVDSGAVFHGAEGNIRVNAINGAGIYRTGWAGYIGTTMGVDNGGGTFSGPIEDVDTVNGHIGKLIKVGTGTQELSGDITIGGNITVEDGVLTLADGGSVTFFPGLNGVNNQILGGGVATGTINANGALNLDLTGTDTTPLNSWLLVDATNVTVVPGATLTVTSTEGAFIDNLDGTWELDAGGNLWTVTFDVAGATLTVAEGTPVVVGPTDEEISSGEFVSGYAFDGTDANFSFSVFAGSTYEIRRTDDLTVPLASWTTVYGPTDATLDETITPSDLAPGLPEAFYVLIISETPAP